MGQGFPPIYRMAKCRKCLLRCKPCLTVEEAEAILQDASRRQYNGDALCQECHKKSNHSANKKLYKSVGREYGSEEPEAASEEVTNLEGQIALLMKLLAQQEAQ
jgi:hypothetical protein